MFIRWKEWILKVQLALVYLSSITEWLKRESKCAKLVILSSSSYFSQLVNGELGEGLCERTLLTKKVVAGELCTMGKSTRTSCDTAQAQGTRHLEGGEIDSLSVFLFSVCLIKTVNLLSYLFWRAFLTDVQKEPCPVSLHLSRCPMQNRFVHLRLN